MGSPTTSTMMLMIITGYSELVINRMSDKNPIVSDVLVAFGRRQVLH